MPPSPLTPSPLDPLTPIALPIPHSLHIKNNGNVELVFEYDSDWSDLADDEDPDSNDERFQGNDYPEEGAGRRVVVLHFDLLLFNGGVTL